MMSLFHTLFMLIGGHAICDFPLQSDTLAQNKNRNANTELQKHVPWWYWLGSHAITHGVAVAISTGSVWLGLAETVAHALIDFFKCEGKYSIHIDQALHIGCKVLWAAIAYFVK